MSINRESVSTNFISPNKTQYIFFEISSFSQERSKKCSKIRLDFAGNDFVFFHCHFHVLFSKQHWVVNTFFSVDKISCKCEGNVFQKKRLIVTKKKSFFILQKSFSDQKTSSPTKHRSWWCKNFCEHIKTCPSKTLFYLWDKMTKAFFQLIEKFSFFLTVGETFIRGIDSTDEHFTEGSLKKSRWLERTLQRSLFHYLQNFMTVQYTA